MMLLIAVDTWHKKLAPHRFAMIYRHKSSHKGATYLLPNERPEDDEHNVHYDVNYSARQSVGLIEANHQAYGILSTKSQSPESSRFKESRFWILDSTRENKRLMQLR